MTALPRVGCYYAVTPGCGEGGAEWFPCTLAGLEAALGRAAWAAVAGPDQQVTVTRGRTTTTIRTYRQRKRP